MLRRRSLRALKRGYLLRSQLRPSRGPKEMTSLREGIEDVSSGGGPPLAGPIGAGKAEVGANRRLRLLMALRYGLSEAVSLIHSGRTGHYPDAVCAGSLLMSF